MPQMSVSLLPALIIGEAEPHLSGPCHMQQRCHSERRRESRLGPGRSSSLLLQLKGSLQGRVVAVSLDCGPRGGRTGRLSKATGTLGPWEKSGHGLAGWLRAT